LFKKGAANQYRLQYLTPRHPIQGFPHQFACNKPFENIAEETCSPRSLSDFYKPDIRTVYNETINNDSFLLLATTKPVNNKKSVDNKNSAFVSEFLYAEILLYTTLRKPDIIIQLARKSDEFSATSHTRAVIQTHIGKTMNVSQTYVTVLLMPKLSSSKRV